MAPELARLLHDRWDDAEALGLAELTHILVIQPGDEEAEIEQEIGFRPTRNPVDGVPYGAREFCPYWSWLEDLGPAYELLHTVGDEGFAYLIFVEAAEGVPAAILSMCQDYARCG
jgi:hypothetical protein